jgi:hypothetical protein
MEYVYGVYFVLRTNNNNVPVNNFNSIHLEKLSETMENLIRKIGNLPEIQTEYLLNTSLENYHC